MQFSAWGSSYESSVIHSTGPTELFQFCKQLFTKWQIDSFVKQRGRYHHHSVSIRCVLALAEDGWMHLIIPSMITLTPSYHHVRLAASSTSNSILFTLSSTCLLHICFGLSQFRCPFTSSINAFLERYHHPS